MNGLAQLARGLDRDRTHAGRRSSRSGVTASRIRADKVRPVSRDNKVGPPRLLPLRIPGANLSLVPHYYFDTRDGLERIIDDVGLDFASVDAARDEATRELADLAKDALPGSERRELVIEVRDHTRRLLLRAALWFEVAVLAA